MSQNHEHDINNRDMDPLTLTHIIVRQVFTDRGYPIEDDWKSHVNYSTIRYLCDGGELNIECMRQEATKAVTHFQHTENMFYFYNIYIPVALFFATLSVVFNLVALGAEARSPNKTPRKHLLISLSISDLIVTISLLLKRCSDHEDVLDETVRSFLIDKISIPFHMAYIMSPVVILCLIWYNVLAVLVPNRYANLSRPLFTRILVVCLWLAVAFFTLVIHLFGLGPSIVVQIFICFLTATVLLAGLVLQVFIMCKSCRRRHTVISPGRFLEIENRPRNFATTLILVIWCLFCWTPVLGYWLTNDMFNFYAHRFFGTYPYFITALLVLHCHSVLDPIIYCFGYRDVRKPLLQLLGLGESTNLP